MCRDAGEEDALLDWTEELWTAGRQLPTGSNGKPAQDVELDVPDKLTHRSVTALFVSDIAGCQSEYYEAVTQPSCSMHGADACICSIHFDVSAGPPKLHASARETLTRQRRVCVQARMKMLQLLARKPEAASDTPQIRRMRRLRDLLGGVRPVATSDTWYVTPVYSDQIEMLTDV